MDPRLDDYLYVYVDLAGVEGPWPESRPAQEELLKRIGAADWHRSCLVKAHGHLGRHGYDRMIERLTLDVGFGMRWFEVWRASSGSQLAVVKKAAPETSVVVAVALGATANPEGLRASFSLLSGRVLGTSLFIDITAETPLFVSDLREAASERALLHGLLETRRQRVKLALPGFHSDPPNGLLLCATPNPTAAELEAWLALMRPLSPAQLAAYSVPTSPDADTSSGLDDSDGSSDWIMEQSSDEESAGPHEP